MRKICFVSCLCIVISVALSSKVFAENGKQDADNTSSRPAAGVSVNYASGGFTIPAGRFCAALNYRYSDQDEWYEDTSSIDGTDMQKIGNLNCIKFRYGTLTEDWRMEAKLIKVF